MQNERVVCASAFQIEKFRSELISLKTQYSAASADLPKLEGKWKVQQETMERSYELRVIEFTKQKDADEQALYAKRESLNLQIR